MAIKVIFTFKWICAVLSQNVSSVCINLFFNIFKIFSMDENYEWMIFKLMHLINKGDFVLLIVVHVTLSCIGNQETIALSCNLSLHIMQWCWLMAYLWRKKLKYIFYTTARVLVLYIHLVWHYPETLYFIYLCIHSFILHIHQYVYCLLLCALCCARHGFKHIIKC